MALQDVASSDSAPRVAAAVEEALVKTSVFYLLPGVVNYRFTALGVTFGKKVKSTTGKTWRSQGGFFGNFLSFAVALLDLWPWVSGCDHVNKRIFF